MKNTKNIEFVFLAIITACLVTLVATTAGLIISMNNFAKEHPGNRTGAEWASVSLIILFLANIYTLILFLLQLRIWRKFSRTGKRKYLQLALIFILGIFPFFTLLLHLFLTEVAGMEDPVTWRILEVYLWIIL